MITYGEKPTTERQRMKAEAYERAKEKRIRYVTDAEYAAYLDRQREYAKKFRERHPDYHRKYYVRKYVDNPAPQTIEAKRAYQKKWREEHPDYHRQYREQRRTEERKKLETKKAKKKRILDALPLETRKAVEALETLRKAGKA